MPMQHAIAMCHDFLQTMLEFVVRLPPPAAGVLMIAVGVCLYESLGNSRRPGMWR